MRWVGACEISVPANRTWPRRWTQPAIALSVVDLPAPLRPSSPSASPGPTSSATSDRICAGPYQAERPETLRRAAGSAMRAQIRIAHGGIAPHVIRQTGCNHPPAVQHHHAIRIIEHHIHVVLGEQDRETALAR